MEHGGEVDAVYRQNCAGPGIRIAAGGIPGPFSGIDFLPGADGQSGRVRRWVWARTLGRVEVRMRKIMKFDSGADGFKFMIYVLAVFAFVVVAAGAVFLAMNF